MSNPSLTQILEGRRIRFASTNGKELVLQCFDGHRVRIKWEEGEPVLSGVDVVVRVGPRSNVAAPQVRAG